MLAAVGSRKRVKRSARRAVRGKPIDALTRAAHSLPIISSDYSIRPTPIDLTLRVAKPKVLIRLPCVVRRSGRGSAYAGRYAACKMARARVLCRSKSARRCAGSAVFARRRPSASKKDPPDAADAFANACCVSVRHAPQRRAEDPKNKRCKTKGVRAVWRTVRF